MLSDFKFALRLLSKSRGFAITTIATMALGIGACTTMFSLVDAVLLKPLPFPLPDRLVWVENIYGGGFSGRTFRSDVFKGWREQSQTITALAGYSAFSDYDRYLFKSRGSPEALRGAQVTDNFLPTLGIPLLLGRNFNATECAFHGPPAVILCYRFWRERFNSDPAIVGQTIELNLAAATVVGVLPPSFDFSATFTPGSGVDILIPFPVSPETAAYGDSLFGIGRLRPGVTPREAQAELTVITERLRHGNLPNPQWLGGAIVTSLDQALRGRFRYAFLALAAAVACVLAIACVNLSTLLLARVNNRQPEFAVRIALGARPRHLVVQSLVESCVLTTAGAAIGIPFAFWATARLARLPVFSIPLLSGAAVDWRALAVTLALMTATGVAAGVLPILQLLHGHPGQSPNASSHQRTISRSAASIRDGLIVFEIALACTLLIGAGLLLRSFDKLLQVDLGFSPEHAIAWRIDSARDFKTEDASARYFDELVRKIASLPGVSDVGVSDTLPLGRNRGWSVTAKGAAQGKVVGSAGFPRLVNKNYIRTMRIPLLAGRLFDERDDRPEARTAVINKSLADSLWPNRDPIGQTFKIYWSKDVWTVVGVVKNVRHSSLEQEGSGEMYFDYHQIGAGAIEMVVRSARPDSSLVPDVRAAMTAYDPDLPRDEFRDLDQVVDDAMAPRRFITRLLGSFSIAALFLTAIGLYGVISYSVSQRTREIGIRSALGAPGHAIIALFMRRGSWLILSGLCCGLVTSFMLTNVLRTLLFGVTATDPLTYAEVAALLLSVALVASYLPARRAVRIDPLIALRSE